MHLTAEPVVAIRQAALFVACLRGCCGSLYVQFADAAIVASEGQNAVPAPQAELQLMEKAARALPKSMTW